MLGRRRAECTTGRSGVTVKAPNFQFAAFILHIPQRSLPQLCYSPPGLFESVRLLRVFASVSPTGSRRCRAT